MSMDHPVRIFATVNGASTRLPDGSCQLIGGWCEDKTRPRVQEYVRADIADDLLGALRPFIPAYRAYIETMQNFIVEGETLADRRESESERRESASENAFEELAKVSFDQLAAVAKAISKAEGKP